MFRRRGRRPRRNPDEGQGPGRDLRAGCPAVALSNVRWHGTRDRQPPRRPPTGDRRRHRPGSGGRSARLGRARRTGADGQDGGHRRPVRLPLPVGRRRGGGRARRRGLAARPRHRGDPGRPGTAAAVDGLDRPAPPRRPGARRSAARRRRDGHRLRGQRTAQDGRRRGAALPRPGRRHHRRPLPAARRLVLPQQPLHPRRRPRGGTGRDPAPARGRGAAPGRPRRPAAGGRRRALSARRAGRVRPGGRRRRRGPPRPAAPRRQAALTVLTVLTALTVGARRSCPPRGRRPRPRPGCPPPAGPGSSSHAP